MVSFEHLNKLFRYVSSFFLDTMREPSWRHRVTEVNLETKPGGGLFLKYDDSGVCACLQRGGWRRNSSILSRRESRKDESGRWRTAATPAGGRMQCISKWRDVSRVSVYGRGIFRCLCVSKYSGCPGGGSAYYNIKWNPLEVTGNIYETLTVPGMYFTSLFFTPLGYREILTPLRYRGFFSPSYSTGFFRLSYGTVLL